MRSENPTNEYGSTSDHEEQPISRTYQYRKVMKPMLERKRRARINRCLDELKELMVGALAAEGENVSKLEKADILELTVRHLHRLRRTQRLALTPEAAYADRFRAGFSHCAAEVSRYLGAVTSANGGGVEAHVGARLLTHLGHCLQNIEKPQQQHSPTAIGRPQGTTQLPLTGDMGRSNSAPVHNYAYNTPPTSPQPLSPSNAHESVIVCHPESKIASPTIESQGAVWRPW
ncbi:hypothetical protein J437_LFUL017858 [Ladona fulva]|uniref:Uncharacterized protein n=1 Tax=Ladona fulva TaxID=123851 RepID=A0A8K0KNF2_LADFU|nr:hypothetical protein J437_LFUL017858 [Ladona fulva]